LSGIVCAMHTVSFVFQLLYVYIGISSAFAWIKCDNMQSTVPKHK